MNNMNIDNNTVDKIKNLVENGNISDALSQISPEMINNFSKVLSNSNNEKNTSNKTSNQESTNNFNINNIDINTITKISSTLNKLNTNNDPRADLLKSLKPYLRDTKKNKLDSYMNLLNIAKVAEIFKDTNKENNNNV